MSASPALSQPAVKPEVYDDHEAKTRWSFSPLKALLVILLIVIPCWLYYQSQETARASEEQKLKKWEEDNPVLKQQKLRNSLPHFDH